MAFLMGDALGVMRARLVRFGVILVALCATAGCTSWSRLNQNAPVPARGTVQVWSAGQEILLRDPKMVGDSLVGHRALPDTARAAVALNAIDSVRAQTTDMGKVLIVGTGVALAVLLVYAEGLEGMRY
jgi:hypothetical protein